MERCMCRSPGPPPAGPSRLLTHSLLVWCPSLSPPAVTQKHQAPEGVQRQRPMRHTLLLLLTLVLAANLVWAAQGVAAWRRGRAGGGEGEQLLLQRLNSTTLSVEVRLQLRWGLQGPAAFLIVTVPRLRARPHSCVKHVPPHVHPPPSSPCRR